MSYLALARKWRPTKFNEVVGQAHVLTALENALTQNRLHHAYLLSGTRGVGKTSIGRLFAKGLNCETGITATPCGECDTCKEIDEGRFVDLLEIDAASRTKVEDTRDLLDNVQYKPARGRFKIYLIDEVHMLSRHSFNALLKTLEEPPEYVKFILATTDPQKLPVTILSRCLQFHLKPISVDTIHQQLDHILAQESVSSEPRALGMISHAADGSMRDALSLTDQAIALGNGHVESTLVAHMLGTLDTDQAIHLLEAISHKQPKMAMDCIEKLAENGVEWDGLLQQLAAQLHRMAMYQALPATLDKEQPDAEKVELLSQALSPQDIQLYYQIVLKGRSDLAQAPSARMGLEMIVLRMLAFRPATVTGASRISTQLSDAPVAAPNQPQHSAAIDKSSAQAASSAVHTASMHEATMHEATMNSASTTTAPVMTNQPIQQSAVESGINNSGVNNSGVVGSELTPPSYDQYDRPSHGYMPEEEAPYVPQEQRVHSRTQQMNSEQPQAAQAEVIPPQTPANPEPTKTASSPLSGLRHQLRSQRQGLKSAPNASNDQPTGSPRTTPQVQDSRPKKPRAASAKSETVLDRVAKKHSGTAPVSLSSHSSLIEGAENAQTSGDEPYQWKASKPIAPKQDNGLTPTQIKAALEHIKTPEMVDRLMSESIEQSEWAALIQKLETAKLVEQLALNSSYRQEGNTVNLTLRSTQAHLNTERACQELQQALSRVQGNECQLVVEVGESGETPLELREKLYQGKLQQAFDSLAADNNVQFIEKRFAATLDRDSVRPI
ncbi:DNA polymerase III subunit gamma/tau [Vibrio genomosp. F10]|uniref:DNA polymerase III subunit gamma/tau n=2 Tax=Vibrio genomosp. F10 TaxID=723171 RepID=A0A1B9QUN4_9VIBR|nr:DNA polymerase III subunit gamma/tau [Vibrio genomosp. F10]OCH70312.1 DNA polymerase III subunit gamma/tau [Vibrio genomosp. F10]